MARLRVAMVGPPWLRIPPEGYGGIEKVVEHLVIELKKFDVEVELFATKDTSSLADKLHAYYESGQYEHISKPLYDAVTLPITQILFSLEQIKRDGKFDIIHDHNGFLGPASMAFLNPHDFPPVLHTLHGPFSTDDMVANGMPDNRPMYSQFGETAGLYFNGISQAQLLEAPSALRKLLVPVVYNAIDPEAYPYKDKKDDYFITLARFARDKGQAVAAKLCEELNFRLKMAGAVDGIDNPRKLLLELASRTSLHSNNGDFVYYREEVLPLLVPHQIEFIGGVGGERKLQLIANARALLFPIDWDEPFGLAVIEALACGTPVIAMRRGAMSEIIRHGVNGFLADSIEEFKEYMTKIDLIDPADCRASIEAKFSASVMARDYLARYQEIIAKSRA